MHWFTGFVVFMMVWWTVLFAVLPLGTKPVAEPDPITGWRGAPAEPQLRRKLFLTTCIAVVLWGIAMLLIRSDYLSFRSPEF